MSGAPGRADVRDCGIGRVALGVPWLAGVVHHLTRSTLAAGTLILAFGAAFAMQPRTPAASVPGGSASSSAGAAASGATTLNEPGLTQRKGEWSPICATTQQPLVDFSPVDRGNGHHRILVTVHNCSALPVDLTQPLVWLGGREGMTDYLRLDAERTHLTPLSLPAWQSAQGVLNWEDDGRACTGQGCSDVLSLRVPGIGEGELRDSLGLTLTTRAWLSGWTR